MVTLHEAERIRKALNLTEYDFSSRLNMSSSAYRKALLNKKLSRRMQLEISMRYGKVLSAIREE